MGGSEIYFIAAIIAAIAFLIGRDRWRHQRHLATADAYGLLPARTDIAHLPACLQDTVLFLVADGGHERDVLLGTLSLAPEGENEGDGDGDGQSEPGDEATSETDIPVTVFDFQFQRDVRGEWGYLDAHPRFRIFSPLTVVAFQLPQELPHLLLKRRGRAEVIAEDGLDRYSSPVDVVRDISTIERAIAVPPPASLPREPETPTALSADYLLWTGQSSWASDLLDADLTAFLRTPAFMAREVVVEALGSLLLVYCAKNGALMGDTSSGFIDQARDLCRQLCRRLDALTGPSVDAEGGAS